MKLYLRRRSVTWFEQSRRFDHWIQCRHWCFEASLELRRPSQRGASSETTDKYRYHPQKSLRLLEWVTGRLTRPWKALDCWNQESGLPRTFPSHLEQLPHFLLPKSRYLLFEKECYCHRYYSSGCPIACHSRHLYHLRGSP